MAEDMSLGALRPGVRLRGVLPNQVVTLASVFAVSDGVAEVSYRDEDGRLAERVLAEADAAGLEVVADVEAGPAFDGDPDEFRMAAEALRIKYAALYDPMVAVNSSDVRPLPHQIRAVYEELLPRVPLRYLLADDPGAGKTIMAGLYLKELILRSDCERAIIVAPGGLVEQWREELATKFDLRFEVFDQHLIDEANGRNPFAEHPRLICRMDQLSRREDLMEQLGDVAWDVAVVDEAHRMSAHYWGGEVDETKRFKLGRLLSETAQNLLLMTATPHAGKEDDFQLFMSLLDKDRFEGQFREGVHHTDTTGLMRRMVKEDLLTFEGKPLFPERRAYTVMYRLSDAERELYERVTEYVRTQMGKADEIARSGDSKRGRNIGFALTILQRRLASSPEAILRSLERRQDRLRDRLVQTERGAYEAQQEPDFSLDDYDDVDGDLSEDQRETGAEQVVDLATAALTVEELRLEIAVLDDLIKTARRVRNLDEDKKWVELRSILREQVLRDDGSGSPRKIIIFTEHRDTLNYLHGKIRQYLGRREAVVTIHGGTPREARKQIREQFAEVPDTVVLLATDAAGEGLNLQRAHLMVNYDLPWNPNRIEQRFGRIHRIGQETVCHLWNMVADDTREGEVFQRLLDKIAQMGKAYNGNLFNVLGEAKAFSGDSLKALLIEAIRYGDRPEVKARLERTIDASVADGLDELLREKALHPEMYPSLDLEEVRRAMERARERRLQPGYIRAFFLSAFERLGGRVRQRETGRWQVVRVPARVQEQARRANRWLPVPDQYERITFETKHIRPPGGADATLIAPGHPLLQAVIELTVDDLAGALRAGTVFVDRREDQAPTPSLLFAVEQKIENQPGHQTVSHHFDYVRLDPRGQATVTLAPPYLDYDSPSPEESAAIAQVRAQPWVAANNERAIRAWAYREGLRPRMEELGARMEAEAARVRQQVYERLSLEINHWDREHTRLAEAERAGRPGRISSETAHARARARERRFDDRMEQLDQAVQLTALPAHVRACALVVPSRAVAPQGQATAAQREAKETEAVERRAVDLVLAAERKLGRVPEEMPHFNPGYDIRSTDPEGRVFFIEVKGRVKGSPTFCVTANEVALAQTQGDRHRLALVAVDPDDPARDEARYLADPFAAFQTNAEVRSYNLDWKAYWSNGTEPR
jgi:superfamily II DNA or RNA helicase